MLSLTDGYLGILYTVLFHECLKVSISGQCQHLASTSMGRLMGAWGMATAGRVGTWGLVPRQSKPGDFCMCLISDGMGWEGRTLG